MTVGLFWHPAIFLHDLHARHAAMEARRLETIAHTLLPLDKIHPVLAEPATSAQMERAHHPEYLEILSRTSALQDEETAWFASDTTANRYTWRAQQLSAGAACQAVDAVLSGRFDHAFNPVYAGHHADYNGAAGFCFVNTVLIGALHAQAVGAKRIAILDFDVHSGNGTVMGLMDKPEFLFAETFQPGYPGAYLQKLNRPAHILRKKCSERRDFIRAWAGFFEELRAWKPDLVFVSAGFDAHWADPLGTLKLVDQDYVWLAEELRNLDAPVVATLEGGYSTARTLRAAHRCS